MQFPVCVSPSWLSGPRALQSRTAVPFPEPPQSPAFVVVTRYGQHPRRMYSSTTLSAGGPPFSESAKPRAQLPSDAPLFPSASSGDGDSHAPPAAITSRHQSRERFKNAWSVHGGPPPLSDATVTLEPHDPTYQTCTGPASPCRAKLLLASLSLANTPGNPASAPSASYDPEPPAWQSHTFTSR